MGHESGIKAIAVYRDGSKAFQPVNTTKDTGESSPRDRSDEDLPEVRSTSHRERPSGTRAGRTHKFEVGGQSFYATINDYDDGRPL